MWKFQGWKVENVEQLGNDLEGFVYKITNLKTGKFYIGKKNFYSKRKKALSKKALPTDKRKKTYEMVTRESDWLKYWGSCKELQEDVKALGEHAFVREILHVARTKKFLTYLELKYQIQEEVLEKPSYNGNILGRYYSRDIER